MRIRTSRGTSKIQILTNFKYESQTCASYVSIKSSGGQSLPFNYSAHPSGSPSKEFTTQIKFSGYSIKTCVDANTLILRDKFTFQWALSYAVVFVVVTIPSAMVTQIKWTIEPDFLFYQKKKVRQFKAKNVRLESCAQMWRVSYHYYFYYYHYHCQWRKSSICLLFSVCEVM